MTQKINLKIFPIKSASLVKRMLLGALIGLIFITIFLWEQETQIRSGENYG